MGILLMVSMLVFLLVSVPIAISLGLASALVVWWQGELPLLLLAQREFASVDSVPLMAIPFFILAGLLMEEGGISKRLVNMASALIGHLTGGLGMVSVVTAMFFATVSGSSAATTAAIGAILIPAMINQGYRRDFSAAVQAVSGELGVIIPPSIPLILYGVATQTSITHLFIAGVIPGIFVGISLMATVYVLSRKRGFSKENRATWSERYRTFREAFWALLMPFIILGGIYGGVFTPTEAAAIAIVYALIIGLFVYREIRWRRLLSLLGDAVITTSAVMFIIANTGLFSWILSRANVAAKVGAFFVDLSSSPVVFLLIVNLLLFIVGMFFETSPAIIILAPLLTPVAVHMGIDPIHFGIIMIVNLAMGMCTPPLGINLFISCDIANIGLEQITRAVLPFIVVLIADVLILSYLPFLSLWLPGVFR